MTFFILGVFVGLIWAATAILFAIVLSVQGLAIVERIKVKLEPKKKAYITPPEPIDTKEADERGEDLAIEDVL